MRSASQDLIDLLVTAGVGVLGTSLFFSQEPSTDAGPVVIAYDDGGDTPASKYTYFKSEVQIRVRGNKNKYSEAYTKIQEVYTALHGLYNEEVSGTRYIQILASSDVLNLGFDENERPMLALNFMAHRTTA